MKLLKSELTFPTTLSSSFFSQYHQKYTTISLKISLAFAIFHLSINPQCSSSYRSQSIDLQSKSIDWLLYDEEQSTFETWKKYFLLYFKSSFRSQENQIFEFQTFKFHDVINCLSIKQEIHFTEYLGSKHSLLMKFDQFTLYYKTKNSAKIATFFVCEELSITSIGK